MIRTAHHRTAFVLLFTLLLLAMVAGSMAALATVAVTEGSIAHRRGHDVDHRLALESLLANLNAVRGDEGSWEQRADKSEYFELQVGVCLVEAVLRSEQGKLAIGAGSASGIALSAVHSIAAQHGLNVDDIQLRPLFADATTKLWPKYHWFDQVVNPNAFGRVFQYDPPLPAQETPQAPVWSDVITFWKHSQRPTWSVEATTRIGTDIRRWYAVCAIEDRKTDVLFLAPLM